MRLTSKAVSRATSCSSLDLLLLTCQVPRKPAKAEGSSNSQPIRRRLPCVCFFLQAWRLQKRAGVYGFTLTCVVGSIAAEEKPCLRNSPPACCW